VITYDTRLGAREFAMESAKVFLAKGYRVKFAEEAAGGENMTPSHNPLPTQGQRWNLSNGDVAPTSVTDRIERGANLINLMDSYKERKDGFLGLRFYANLEEQWLIPTIDRVRLSGALFESVIRGLGWEDHMIEYGEKYDERLDVWVSNDPKGRIINYWCDKIEFFEAVRQKMDELARLDSIEPVEIYRKALKLLTMEIDRDTNVRHAAWEVDVGMEYYRQIFK
jgi:hypothetical protein